MAEKKKGFTAEERAAMKERDVLPKIAEMPPSDRKMAKRLHEIVTASAPDLLPRTWQLAAAEEKKIAALVKKAVR